MRIIRTLLAIPYAIFIILVTGLAYLLFGEKRCRAVIQRLEDLERKN